MSTTSYPWRIVAVAVISVGGYVYLAYLALFGLSPGGLDVEDKSGNVVVSYLDNDAPAVRAGLVVGDSILTVDGQPIGNVVDWLAHRMNFVADRPIHIGVERDGRRLDLTMTLHGTIWKDYGPRVRISEITFLANKLITLLIGFFVVFSRPRDFVSRLGGWVLVAMATVFEAFQWGMAASIRSLPFLFQWPVMLVYVSAAVRTPLLFAFFSLFPKRLIRGRWIWIVLLAGPAIATIYALYLLAWTVYDPGHLASLAPPWVLIAFGLQSLIYLLAGLLVLPVGYWRLETPTERRRFRVLFFGALIGLLFYLPRVFSTALVDFNPSIAEFMSSPTANLIDSAGFLVFPLSFAYAILRHRLFDIRVIGAAHLRGLVHRDLKPENIFLVRTGTPEFVKITDFGIAKCLPQVSEDTSGTLTGMLLGTFPYMSPEQLRRDSITVRWDLWALSVIAFESLCGVQPFVGPDLPSLLNAIFEAIYPPVSSLVPQAPPRWQEFFNRAFARSENDRPGSIDEFWTDLRSSFSSS